MPPRKVLMLTNTLETGGTERNLVAICQHIDRTRYEPHVWMLHGGGPLEANLHAAGVPVRNLGRGRARSPLFALRAAREIARANADLVHVFLPAVGFYAALARSLFGLRTPMAFWMGTPKTRRRDRWLFRWFARSFRRVIANSKSVMQVCQDLGFSEEQIVVIENGHDTARFETPIDRAHVRHSLGVRANDTLLLFVGRLIESKRVCDAVDALKLLQPTLPHARLVIVGEGQERAALAAQAARHGIEDRVTFAGYRSDVPNVLRSADLFVFPSESEGLPNSIIEACLARLPIAACDVAGVTDVVQDGRHALLVPPRNPAQLAAAIGRLVDHAEDARRLSAAAHDMAISRFSMAGFMDRLYRAYDELLDHAPASRRDS
jgi:glycosyltransferase involved in cell wall biosynthesis